MPAPRSSMSAELSTKQRDQLERAEERVHALSAEYRRLLADPDAIQEDRDAVRSMLDSARRVAASAQQSVERFEIGAYGVCATCGRPIGAARMQAVPDATKCVTCQGA